MKKIKNKILLIFALGLILVAVNYLFPIRIAKSPTQYWKTYYFTREKLSFKVPPTWTVKNVNRNIGEKTQNPPLVDSDGAMIIGPNGFELFISTGKPYLAEVLNPVLCAAAGLYTCKQYFSEPINILNKNLYFTINGFTTLDGKGEPFESNILGISENRSCVYGCELGLGRARYLPEYIMVTGGYSSKYNLDISKLKDDPNYITAKQILLSLSY